MEDNEIEKAIEQWRIEQKKKMEKWKVELEQTYKVQKRCIGIQIMCLIGSIFCTVMIQLFG